MFVDDCYSIESELVRMNLLLKTYEMKDLLHLAEIVTGIKLSNKN